VHQRDRFVPLVLHKPARYAGVKGLAVVLLGMVFGSGFNGCPQAKNSPQSGNGFGR